MTKKFIENNVDNEFIINIVFIDTANKKPNIEEQDTINFDIVNVFTTVWRDLHDQEFAPV